jgi:hypothetical protein
MAGEPIHPLLRDALIGVGRIGAKAIASAFDSVLEDIGGTSEEVSQRVSRARGRLKKIGRKKPPPQDPQDE